MYEDEYLPAKKIYYSATNNYKQNELKSTPLSSSFERYSGQDSWRPLISTLIPEYNQPLSSIRYVSYIKFVLFVLFVAQFLITAMADYIYIPPFTNHLFSQSPLKITLSVHIRLIRLIRVPFFILILNSSCSLL